MGSRLPATERSGGSFGRDPLNIQRACTGQPIAEGVETTQPLETIQASSVASVPAISDWNSFDDANFASTKKSAKKGASKDTATEKRGVSYQKRFGLPDPLAHLGLCKKRRNCSQCR